MKNTARVWGWAICLQMALGASALAEPIFHERAYPPAASGKVPGVIVLHTSGGYQSINDKVAAYVDAGYAVYTPDFFKRHGLSSKNRYETWTVHRTTIEAEISEIVQLMKSDPRIDARNVFAVGFSNGGYWASYLAATGQVNAGVTQYGVWAFPGNTGGHPVAYFNAASRPVLALVGRQDDVQAFDRVTQQIKRAGQASPSISQHIYEAGHGWDCRTCKDYIYDAAVTANALQKTLKFFSDHTAP